MFTSSRRLRTALAVARDAQDKVVAKVARIHELETNLAASEDRAHLLARSRGDVAHVLDLEQQLKRQVETITQLRKGVVDDAQTAELRRQLHLARRAVRELHARCAELQAANSGIPAIREVTA
ncbi:hypothetical protein ACFXGT_08280 [Streptomyces sp. NPDC059352]|uniref:hypothetical protein n=1 Tax=Streptomyces sp. NPDC059352 TaxID=3346810 RepID=UPI00367EEFAC